MPQFNRTVFIGLGKEIHSRGFCNITNIDVSPVVISQMADLHSDLEEMECTNSLVMN